MKRELIAAGNWKMNKTFDEAMELTQALTENARPTGAKMILAPPAIYLKSVAEAIASVDYIHLAAQNCHQEEKGAYTGEISIQMLKSVGVEYVILGHSERRQYFKESNELLAKKTNLVLQHGLQPIFCCGESLDIRKAEQHIEFVSQQLKESLFHLSSEDFSKIIIAYEPIWAIGTGVTASPQQAQEMHQAIRQMIAFNYNVEQADATSILYGGSVKPANAEDLFGQPDVDGGLVGGASLKAGDFVAIFESFQN
ncbi:MAG: triose-phosphate isomerase [Bacteroidota bacterium]